MLGTSSEVSYRTLSHDMNKLQYSSEISLAYTQI